MQQPSGQGLSLDTIRQRIEDEVLKAVDGVVSRIPNGQQYKDQFHQAINSAMSTLQQQAQSQMGNMSNMMGNLGGMMGQQRDQGTNPPTH